jgi:hypothetical protein
MALFLLASMPLTALLVGAMALSPRSQPGGGEESAGGLARRYLIGLGIGLPGELLVALFRPVVEASYRPGRMYFAVLLGEHALPIALAACGFAAIYAVPFVRARLGRLPSPPEASVLLAGCFTVIALAGYIGQRRDLTGHTLFLLPLLRIATVLACSRFYARLLDARGVFRALPALALALWPFVPAFEGLWARQGRSGAAGLLAVGVLLLTIGALALAQGPPALRSRFPRISVG